jgi:hypothetical protein
VVILAPPIFLPILLSYFLSKNFLKEHSLHALQTPSMHGKVMRTWLRFLTSGSQRVAWHKQEQLLEMCVLWAQLSW